LGHFVVFGQEDRLWARRAALILSNWALILISGPLETIALRPGRYVVIRQGSPAGRRYDFYLSHSAVEAQSAFGVARRSRRAHSQSQSQRDHSQAPVGRRSRSRSRSSQSQSQSHRSQSQSQAQSQSQFAVARRSQQGASRKSHSQAPVAVSTRKRPRAAWAISASAWDWPAAWLATAAFTQDPDARNRVIIGCSRSVPR